MANFRNSICSIVRNFAEHRQLAKNKRVAPVCAGKLVVS
jgi:hypothetical protein